MKKVALSIAFVFMFGTIAVVAQNPKKDTKQKPVTEQKSPTVKTDETAPKSAVIEKKAKPSHKKKHAKKGAKKGTKPAENKTQEAQ